MGPGLSASFESIIASLQSSADPDDSSRSDFRTIREWYVFPFGKPQPTDPTRAVTTLKTVWAKVKKDAGLTGRWHDNRHTFITNLAESGEASDETIRDLAGHVSKEMLKHYSHIGMEAKRRAVAALAVKPAKANPNTPKSIQDPKESPKVGKVN